MDDNEKALEAFGKELDSAKSDTERGSILYMIGIAYQSLKQKEAADAKYREAMGVFKRALDASKNDMEKGEILGMIALLYVVTDEFGSALKYAKKSLAMNKDSYLAHEAMGILLMAQRDFSASSKEIEQAISLFEKPETKHILKYEDVGGLYYVLGSNYGAMNQHSKAVETLSEAVKLSDNDSVKLGAYAFMGASEYSLGECQKSIEFSKKALEIAGKGDVELKRLCYITLSKAEEMLGDYKSSVEHAKTWLELAATKEEKNTILTQISDVYKSLKDYNGAIEYINKAFEHADTDHFRWWALLKLAWIYGDMNDYAKSVETRKRALEYAAKGSHDEAYLLWGIAHDYYMMDDYNSMLKYAKQSLDVAKTNVDKAESLLNIANAYHGLKYYEDAAKYAKEAKELNPNLNINSFLSKVGGGGESGAVHYAAEIPTLNFGSIIGMEPLKNELRRRIIYPLQKPELVSEYGFKGFGGVLLYGPPGCGKTMIVKAAAGEANIKLIDVRIPEIIDRLVGGTEKNIEAVFTSARKAAPCILFFDELEALVMKRELSREVWDVSKVNVFLKQLDELSKSGEHVLVIGATNAPWLIDTAVKRPGRFDKTIYAPAPERSARRDLFVAYLKGKPLDKDVDYDKLADLSPGYSPADIAAICNNAAERALDEAFKTGVKRDVNMRDIVDTMSNTKRSFSEWYEMAANRIMQGSEAELYPDLINEINNYKKERGTENAGIYR